MEIELRNVYSINLAVYVIVFHDINYIIKSDKDNPSKKYVKFDTDISDIINEYKVDKRLQAFLHGFKQLKMEMRNTK